MTEPQPVAADLTDDALFAGLAPPEPQPPSEAGVTATKLALATMLAANMKPAFSFDLADGEALWAVGLAEYGPASIIAAAKELATDPDAEFPTLAEFATLVASFDRASKRPPPPEPEPGEECGECGEERGMVFVTNPLDGGIADRRPCSRCRPVQYELHQAGHFNPRKEHASCHCNHPMCPDTKRREKMAARG